MARAKSPTTKDHRALTAALETLASGGAMVLDAEQRLVAVTPRAVALLGKDALPGVHAAKLLGVDPGKKGLLEALSDGRPSVVTLPRTARRSERRLRVVASPVRDGAGKAGWVLLVEEDSGPGGEEELFERMWSVDPAMKRMFRIIERVARSEATVLVRGETGSGKELVATAIHARSARAQRPFRALNCAAVPGPLLESELFGHVRGAFTGAVRDAPGHFRLAHTGTLFLDEVAELSLDLQAKLLRVLESRTVMPVGGREPVPVDVRIVAATHRALRKAVEAGTFRADLMFRLRVIPIFIPPLRERGADVVLLAERFIEGMNTRSTRKILRIAPSAKDALSRHAWPGNVRELKNVLEYAFAIGEGPVLVPEDLPPELLTPWIAEDRPPSSPSSDVPSAASPEAARILHAIERASGNRAHAAEALGVSRVTLWRRMRELGLLRGERRG